MGRTSDYQGMRWFKCDLHMHTPVDPGHWQGPLLQDDPNESAQAYIRRCYDVGLECIAITDHNFMSKDFIPKLKDAIQKLSSEYGYEITLFPGFEINADVGKGMHLLGIFEPDADLCEIDHILTQCGVPMPRHKSGGAHEPSSQRLPEIIKTVQKRSASGLLNGIVICPHPCKTGIFDNDRISEWLQQHEWKTPDLFAVEVPTPISQMSQGWQRLFGNGDDCDPDWRRIRPMAALMSSDSKTLTDSSVANYIGKRFCWIKMSKPSIESLRQAFLDWESRICLEPKPPRVDHTHVQSISISGTKFLEDQTVIFSPHLNCIIGGRGSGKSMLFESMRLGLRSELPCNDDDEKKHVAVEQINRLRGTFDDSARIELQVHHDGVEDCEETFARCDSELAVLEQEVAELTRQLEARTQVQEELKRHRAAQEAQRYLDSLLVTSQHTEERLKKLVEELEAEPPPLGDRLETFPEKIFFEQTEEKTTRAYQNLTSSLRSATETFRESIDLALSKNPEWQKMQTTIKEAEDQFYAACSEKGLDPQEAEKMREAELQQRTKQATLEAKQVECENFKKQKPDMTILWQQLANCWKEETESRRAVLQEISSSEAMPRIKNGEPVVKTSLVFAGDRDNFLQLWGELAPDRRTNVGRIWDRFSRDGGNDNIGDHLFDAFQSSLNKTPDTPIQSLAEKPDTAIPSPDGTDTQIQWGNPIQWLELHLDKPDCLPPFLQQYLDDIKAVREQKAERWFQLSLKRIPDVADLMLFRSDGTEAGSFLKKALSTGQKNTAILSLLMARGDGPVLIDQPEDELDSEFLFRELVPMLRHSKNRRQLIIVTHNANIPVNADADLVYALQAKNGRGVCRTQGGLDRSAVTKAVLDIMEGSEVAFRRRKEKYHF